MYVLILDNEFYILIFVWLVILNRIVYGWLGVLKIWIFMYFVSVNFSVINNGYLFYIFKF